jgi:uncharacterized protein YndB with AHSA1/START domain
MPDPKTLTLHRIYAAPVSAVWDAWHDLEQVSQWWGPRGFTITTHSKDLRPGGSWRYTMHGPDGTDYPNVTHYHEVEPRARLVYDHGGTDDTPPLFRVTATFREVDGKTHLDFEMQFPSPEHARQTAIFIKKASGESTWDRLAEYLDDQNSQRRFYINRSFNVPIAQMYDTWTKPELLSQWLPPTGSTMEFLEADIRPGGSSRYLMSNPHFRMWGRASYLELDPPHRLVYTQEFCDEAGNLSRHPMAPTWPATLRTTVTFTEEGPTRTRVTVQWEPWNDPKPEEIATFVGGRSGMTQGWTGSFDKLEGVLEA